MIWRPASAHVRAGRTSSLEAAEGDELAHDHTVAAAAVDVAQKGDAIDAIHTLGSKHLSCCEREGNAHIRYMSTSQRWDERSAHHFAAARTWTRWNASGSAASS